MKQCISVFCLFLVFSVLRIDAMTVGVRNVARGLTGQGQNLFSPAAVAATAHVMNGSTYDLLPKIPRRYYSTYADAAALNHFQENQASPVPYFKTLVKPPASFALFRNNLSDMAKDLAYNKSAPGFLKYAKSQELIPEKKFSDYLVFGTPMDFNLDEQVQRLIEDQPFGRVVKSWRTYVPESYDELDKTQKKMITADQYAEYVRRHNQVHDVEIDKFTYTVDDHEVEGFALIPKAEAPEKKPLIIYNRGGHRNWGKNDLMSIMDHMLFLAENGYVVLASQYRGTTDPGITDEFGGVDVADPLKLLEIAEEMDNVDLNNIFLIGFSRGTIMSYRMLQELKKQVPIRAYVGIGGVSHMDSYLQENPKFIKPLLLEAIKDFEENYEQACEKRSVCSFIDVLDDVPTLIIHNTEDPVVPVSQAVKLHEKLQEVGHEKNKLIIYPDKAHSLNKHLDAGKEEILNWLEMHKV